MTTNTSVRDLHTQLKDSLQNDSELAWGLFSNAATIGANLIGSDWRNLNNKLLIDQAYREAGYFMMNVYGYDISKHPKWKDLGIDATFTSN